MNYLEVEKIDDANIDDANIDDANIDTSQNIFDSDEKCILYFLNTSGIICSNISDLDGITILRDLLLNDSTYKKLKKDIHFLKPILSSTSFTSVHKNADVSQKWPLINLIRQILRKYNYQLIPKRVCDGYTKDGIKKYKRLFEIRKDLSV
jgi:hypothetical protein